MNTNRPSFELRLKLGAGGMGQVHLAMMNLVGSSELVALKRLHSEMADRPEHLAQFEAEARITSLLRHPHIVALRRYGIDDDGPFLALEFVEGRSAKDLQAEGGRRMLALPLKVALSIARDAALGLSFAHSFREDSLGVDHIVHGDISPDNILVSYEGVAKVSDFGIARIVGATTLTGTDTTRGKFGYMAPELFEGQKGDTRTDVFAFGATFFRLLTGTAAFPGKTEAELLRAVLNSEPVRPSSLIDLPKAIDDWITRALAKDASERPANLEQLLRLLKVELENEPEEGRLAVSQWILTCFPVDEDEWRTQVVRAVKLEPQTVLKSEKIRFVERRTWPVFLAAALGAAVGSLGYLAWGALARSDHPGPAPAGRILHRSEVDLRSADGGP